MKAVGAYVFAGLFSEGIRQAGYDIVGVAEDGEFGVATARANFPKIPVWTQRTYWPVAQLREMDLDLMYGNPPCAGYSLATRGRGADNPKNVHLDHANELGLEVRPKVFMVESVTQLMTDGHEQVSRWEEAWQKIGYNTTRLWENGGHLGLPQSRRRVLFIASTANLDFYYPEEAPGMTTVRSAIEDLSVCGEDTTEYRVPALNSYQKRMREGSDSLTWHVARGVPRKMATLLPYLPEGKRMRSLSDEIYEQTYWLNDTRPKRGKPSFLYARVKWDAPSSVLTGGATYVHPALDRFYTVREAARLMGVPDRFQFTTLTHAYAEVGKAVSPIVGRWLGEQIKEILADPQGRDHKEEVNLIDAPVYA